MPDPSPPTIDLKANKPSSGVPIVRAPIMGAKSDPGDWMK
jgi:hypothetical protein